MIYLNSVEGNHSASSGQNPLGGEQAEVQPGKLTLSPFNHLRNLRQLRNRVFVVRHGQALSNVMDRTCCEPSSGIVEYGLTEAGCQQVLEGARNWQKADSVQGALRVYYSDFLRTAQSAEIIASTLEAETFVPVLALRERYCGALEGKTSADFYNQVWGEDLLNPLPYQVGMESVAEVLSRVSALTVALDGQWRGDTIVLVTHGDPGNILLSAARGLNPAQHEQNGPLMHGVFYELNINMELAFVF